MATIPDSTVFTTTAQIYEALEETRTAANRRYRHLPRTVFQAQVSQSVVQAALDCNMTRTEFDRVVTQIADHLWCSLVERVQSPADLTGALDANGTPIHD